MQKALRVGWRCSHPICTREDLWLMLRDRYSPVDLFALVPAPTPDDGHWAAVEAVEAILRLLVIQHLYGWSYAETEHFVGDSLVLRQFCRLGVEPVPPFTTLLRWANLLQPETV